MKRIMCLCVLAAGWTGCASLGTDPDAILNEWFGGNAAGAEPGSSAGIFQPVVPPDSPSKVFTNVPGIPQAGARTPDLGAAVAIHVISRSRTAADVAILFTIDTLQVRLTQLHVEPFSTTDVVGPDAAVRVEITGAYATGRATPPLTLVLAESFEAGDEKEYIIPDPDDACPDDPDKFEPGICGCGKPDTDSDSDGTLDCNDACPDDPNKTTAGACGCGEVDVDTDRDGTLDCTDGCPEDPVKTAPGACGCGKADTDSDNDGIADCIKPPAPPPSPPPAEQTYTLSVAVLPSEAGTVTRSPNSATYAAGSVVFLTAAPIEGYLFDHWVLPGGATRTENPIPIVMNASQSVTAVFRPASGDVFRIYVNGRLSVGGDGTSWATAFKDLQDALDLARSKAGSVPVEIWVAWTTYKPDRGTGDRTRTFALSSGVAIYGGFLGTETDLAERNTLYYAATLSGDLLDNDTALGSGTAEGAYGLLSGANTVDNSYHVVTGSGTDATAILDGFTITGGNADDFYIAEQGGGLFIDGGSPTISNCVFWYNSGMSAGGAFIQEGRPTFSNCEFIENLGNNGSGLEAFGGRPTLIGCSFTANLGGYGAGAMFVGGQPTLNGCSFVENQAVSGSFGQGGGVLSSAATLTLTDCVFDGNSAGDEGGAIYVEGGVVKAAGCSFFGNTADGGGGVANVDGSAVLINCVFSGNMAMNEGGGGGVYAVGPAVSTDLINCTFSGNLAPSGYGGGFNSSGAKEPTIANCIFWGNSALAGPQIWGTVALSYSCVEGGAAGTGIIQSDPRFVNAAGADGIVGTADDDTRLAAVSPCIDAGDTLRVPPEITTDLDGGARFLDDPCTADTGRTTGGRPAVDMGAYEFVPSGACDLRNLDAVPQAASVALAWQGFPAASGYRVYVDAGNGFDVGSDVGTGSNCVVPNLTNGVRYRFKVTARYGAGIESAGLQRFATPFAGSNGLIADYTIDGYPLQLVEGPIFHGYWSDCAATSNNYYQDACTPVISSPVNWAWGSNFTVTWTGYLYAPDAGDYRFAARYWVDGDVYIEVNHAVIADLNTTGAGYSTVITLDEGTWVPVTMTFTPNGGSNNMHLAWVPPGKTWEAVPRRFLTTYVSQAP